jgi:hypothetical protein
MLKKLLEPEVKDICPNCGQASASSDVLCPNCGKNLDELFEQLPDSDVPHAPLIKFLKSLLVILIGILVGIASAIIAVYVLFTYGSLSDNGSFVQWRSLGSPPENIAKIVGICDNTVCVQTNNNKIYGVSAYGCDVLSQSCWKELEQPIIEEDHFGSCWFRFAEKNPPKRVIQIMKTNNCGSGGAIQTNYALLADGNIWIWEHTVSDLQGLQWFVLAIPVAVISFIIGVALVLIYVPIVWKKRETAIP